MIFLSIKTIKTIKTSTSIRKNIWDRLKKHPNRSLVINNALELFFAREEMLREADKEYWDHVARSLQTGDGQYVKVGTGETLTSEDLETSLWN